MDQIDYIVPEIEYELAMDDVLATPKHFVDLREENLCERRRESK